VAELKETRWKSSNGAASNAVQHPSALMLLLICLARILSLNLVK
jgi:hypothetical protein